MYMNKMQVWSLRAIGCSPGKNDKGSIICSSLVKTRSSVLESWPCLYLVGEVTCWSKLFL